jgi:hypothetical protein
MKNKLFVTALAGLFSLGIAACDKKEEAMTKTETKTETKPAGGETKTTDTKTETKTTTTGDNKIGVASCDKWMEKYTACINSKVPEAGRAQMLDAMKQTADTWKQTASTDEGKAALAKACDQMIESTKQATASLGCEW